MRKSVELQQGKEVQTLKIIVEGWEWEMGINGFFSVLITFNFKNNGTKRLETNMIELELRLN